jgi:hypothetical protein
MKSLVSKFVGSEEGQDTIEWGLLILVIVAAALAFLIPVGNKGSVRNVNGAHP